MDSELSEKSEGKVGMRQGSVLSPFLFTVMVDVVTEFARQGALSELLCADDLVLMSVTIKGLRNMCMKWKEVSVSKDFKSTLESPRQWSVAASQRMACLKVKLIHVGMQLESKGELNFVFTVW